MVDVTSPFKPGAKSAEHVRLISVGDAFRVVRLSLIALASWIIPVRSWSGLSSLLAGIDMRLRPEEMVARAREISCVAGTSVDFDVDKVVRASMAAHCESQLQHFRCYRPGGWLPEPRLVGRDHIDRGLAQGKGVVLWMSNFTFNDLVSKIALAEAGFGVTHLSRPSHGYSSTRFGMRFLNPLQLFIEDRFLEERVEILDRGPVRALMTLRDRLQKNAVVSITVGDQAQRVVQAPFMNGAINLSTGPAELARMTGAVLLPVFTVRDSDGGYCVQVGRPLGRAGTEGAEYFQSMADEYAGQLAPLVLEHPECWKSWELVSFDAISS
jgi:lauroyl/myristoyl acyltransferase